jgi:hypothetical protein
MAIIQLEHAYPVEYQSNNQASWNIIPNADEAKLAGYITTWKQQLRSVFIQRRNIWDDCWKLYRGLDDWSRKDDWQSKIVLPKAWTSVKMATNTIKRLLAAAKNPWDIESVNPDDLVNVLRAEQMTDLTRVFLDKAYWLKEFSEGLECGFLLGLGVWKLWWGLRPRKQTRVETQMIEVPYQGGQGMGGISGMGQMGGPGQQGPGGDILQPEPAPQQVPPTTLWVPKPGC